MSNRTIPAYDQTLTRVREVLGELLGDGVQSAADDQPLTEALGDRYDSLAALECVSRVEGAFGIEVDFVAHDVRYSFATLGRIAEFVQGELEDRAVLENLG
ncbi:acyl carrier protein [Streptomyces marispadix]|jgi:acyl carrier protein|uniref:Acyl carrier protein n=1 Tax=Streptomyces marispadix TaxID=2922868 RepID=A0ABS9T2S9_9ACTN|nr:acyl carrier protein [Streptomyces marispadix]MCH6162576.1 acyl carrier protein [Streptomyces marispadix]